MVKVICPNCKKEIDEIITVYTNYGSSWYSMRYDKETREYLDEDYINNEHYETEFDHAECGECGEYLDSELFEDFPSKPKSKKKQLKYIVLKELTK